MTQSKPVQKHGILGNGDFLFIEYEGVTEKENKEASPVKEKPKPVPDSGGGGNGSTETTESRTTESSKEETTEEPEAKQDKEDRK